MYTLPIEYEDDCPEYEVRYIVVAPEEVEPKEQEEQK